MAKGDVSIVPLIYQRLKDNFGEPDWVVFMNGPYELTNPIQTMMLEAGQKGMAVVVQASLVPTEDIFEDEPEPSTMDDLEQEIENSKKGK